MSDERDGLVEGRIRRGRGPLLALAMVAVLGAVWWIGGRFGGGRADDEPVPGVSVIEDLPPTGRLVYATDATDGPPDRPQRLMVLDLTTGEVTAGPSVPTVEELVAVGPDRSSFVVVTDLGAEGAAYLVDHLSPDAVPEEITRGDLLAVSNRGNWVVAARTESTASERPPGAACVGTRFAIVVAEAFTAREGEAARDRIECGRVLSVAAVSAQVYASLLEDDLVRTAAASGGELGTFIFGGGALVSAGPDGSWLTIQGEAEGWPALEVWPHTPVGTFLWSRGPSAPRPLVPDLDLVGERVVAWSGDADRVVVVGTLEGRRSMWLVETEGGSAVRLFPAGSVALRAGASGASFDAEGRVFAVADGALVVATSEGVEGSVPLIVGAPRPNGPVVWLP
jgi:hypothetical protein